MGKGKKGQTATEYMIIFGAVLIVAFALISVYLYGAVTEGKEVERSRLFWLTQKPLAIVEASASMEPPFSDGENYVVMRLKNTGDHPIELLAIRQQEAGSKGKLDNTAFGEVDSSGGYKYFSPDANVGYGDYNAYVSRPKGNGFAMQSSRVLLFPGEEVVVGFGVVSQLEIRAQYGPKSVCKDLSTGEEGRYMEFEKMEIFVVEKIGNQSIVKKIGPYRLAIPCVERYASLQ
ncbi:MAG: class III signal peptide-containing protein [Candidatus Micrarchaeota archaeon]|nr:class III signal peptide-containing protein [Candidatus Micrarchaeota archaeon]